MIKSAVSEGVLAMNEIVNAFFKISAEKFQFLVDEFGFRRGAQKSESGLYRVLYENETTAVEIGMEWQEQYVYVELFRLINGEIKENPIMIGHDSELAVFNLEDLLGIRAPKMTLDPEYFGTRITLGSLDHVLGHYARSLKEVGKDVLHGDFTVFRELESIVKARISRSLSAEGKPSVARVARPSKRSSVKISGREQAR